MKTNVKTNNYISSMQNKFLFAFAIIAILFMSLLALNGNITKASADSEKTDSSKEACQICKGYDKETKFNMNTTFMKDAAVDYFTNERLPQTNNTSKKITLGEMINERLLYTIVDSNGKACSLTDSYVEVTKYESEYVFKVMLSCSDISDYILVHKGCADYCGNNECVVPEKEEELPKEYEYEKSKACTMTDWSDWSDWTNVREEITNDNYKREETRTQTLTEKEVLEETPEIKVSYNCNKYDGYELVGSVCIKTNTDILEEDAEENPVTYNCDAYDGYELVEGTNICRKTTTVTDEQPAEENDKTYNCDKYGEGYELVEGTTTCLKVTTIVDEQPAEKNPTTYNCDKYGENYVLNEETLKCVKDIEEHDIQDATPEKSTRRHERTCSRDKSCRRWIPGTETTEVCDANGCYDVPGTSGHWETYTCGTEYYDCSYNEEYISGYNCDKYGSDYVLNSETHKCLKDISEHDIQDAEEDEPSYNCDKYGEDYELNDNNMCVKTTETRDEQPAEENEPTYNCDKYGEEYELNGTVCVKTTETTDEQPAEENEKTYNCDKYDGYTLVGNKCVKCDCEFCTKEADKEEEKNCKEGYTLNGDVCTREIEKEKTITEYRYSTRACINGGSEKKWSLDINDIELILQGFKRTGRTRSLVITK